MEGCKYCIGDLDLQIKHLTKTDYNKAVHMVCMEKNSILHFSPCGAIAVEVNYCPMCGRKLVKS